MSFIILFFIAMTEARAQESMISLPMPEVEKSQSTEKQFQLAISLERSSNLQRESSPDKDDALSLIFVPVYEISEKSNIEGRIDFVESDEKERTRNFTNSVVVYKPTTIDLTEELKFQPKVSVTLPTDDQARDDQSYQGSFSLRPTLEYTPAKIPGLTLANILYMTKNFHEYEFRRDFTANNEFSLRNRFVIQYAFTEKFSLELINDFVKSWSYNGYSKDEFYFAQELAYEFYTDWSTYLSHKNEGAARGPNNHGENVEIYKGTQNSYVSLGLTHVF